MTEEVFLVAMQEYVKSLQGHGIDADEPLGESVSSLNIVLVVLHAQKIMDGAPIVDEGDGVPLTLRNMPSQLFGKGVLAAG